ncbi:uncharacterized protein KIAA1958-like [Ptychodera flava]|uniref:uncharacterized protein KIAA1958-like n=1 Tax=Ptychodera flava TaxID=63121 RepID=UPI003969F460
MDVTDSLSEISEGEYDSDIERYVSQFDLFKFDTATASVEQDLQEDFKLTKAQELSRFAEPVGAEELAEIQRSRVPRNTTKSTNWGVNVWDSWGRNRNQCITNSGVKSSEMYTLVPALARDIEASELCFWLCRFVVEVRQQCGSQYPSQSLRVLCSGIQRYLRDECRRPDLAFMDTNRGEFQDFHHTIDGVMKKTDRSGIGAEKRQAQPFTREDEGQLWDKVFSIDNAQNLSYAVYFYVSKVFALRASDEHNNLQAEQFVFGTDKEGEFVEFRGRPCKNNQGGFYNSRKVPYKNIRQYSDPSNPRCVVKLLKNYLGLIPSKGAFYRRPLPKKTTTNAIKFSSQKIGINTI